MGPKACSSIDDRFGHRDMADSAIRILPLTFPLYDVTGRTLVKFYTFRAPTGIILNQLS